ncbi:MAG TPA: acyl-CoA dehydrogenase family protein [Actinomycetota bacterium]|nr:acyl-CoA dehydrogenase family protein [Actinomycetota bacterium]
MDFAFSDEQNMLREQARQFLADKYGHEQVAKLATSDDGWDPSSWSTVAELGWTGLSIPEEHGGAGMGFIDEAVIFEELGRALYPGPYFSTIALALPALQGSPKHLAAIAAGEKSATFAWAEPSGVVSLMHTDGISTKAERTNGTWSLTGEKHLVPDAGIADLFVVTAASPDGVGLFLVEKNALQVSVDSTMDRTRRFAKISMSGANATELVSGEEARDVLVQTRNRTLAALALEAVGIAGMAVDLSIAHVSERKQFDKPIGAYQAVSHQVADGFMETELARSLAYWAAWCVDETDEQVSVAVSAAKAAAGSAAVNACEKAIQVHGGIGFTWEHPLHLFYKRAQWIDAFAGRPTLHREWIARSLLGSPK